MQDSRVAAPSAAGDARALHSAYDMYADRVYDYALTLTGDPAVASKVTLDVFTALRDRPDRLAAPAQLRVWLYALVRTCGPRNLDAQAPWPTAGDDGRRAAAVAANLPPDLSEVFELVYRHGLDADDLELVLGLSTNRVAGRLVVVRETMSRQAGLPQAARLASLPLRPAPPEIGVKLFEETPTEAATEPGRHRERSRRPWGRVATAAVASLFLVGSGAVIAQNRAGDNAPERAQLAGEDLGDRAPDPAAAPSTEAPPEAGPDRRPDEQLETPATPGPSPDKREPAADRGDDETAAPADATPSVDVPGVGTVSVSPSEITLRRGGDPQRVRLTAVGGDVDWVAIVMGPGGDVLELDVASGSLAEGESRWVTIDALAGAAVAGLTPLRLVFQPGSSTVDVRIRLLVTP